MRMLRNKSPIIIFILLAHFYILDLPPPQAQQEPSLKAKDNLLLKTVLSEGF